MLGVRLYGPAANIQSGLMKHRAVFFLVTKCILIHGSTHSFSCAEQSKLNEMFMRDFHETSTFEIFYGSEAFFIDKFH
jgi:hypothetical protein